MPHFRKLIRSQGTTLRRFSLALLFAAPGHGEHTLTESQRKFLTGWLAKHSELHLATDADCDCQEDIIETRKTVNSVWKGVADYHPYVVTGDFNGDGHTDIAVVLFTPQRPPDQYTLAIFNGPLQIGGQNPASLKAGLNLKYHRLFFGPPRPKPYRLVLGRFDVAGIVNEPQGRSNRMVVP